ncbi:MAG: TM0106 family RecB-like putative nuclease [Actinobacteria bacterium]|nr:TM0106 family RecB-like putative nuclease [Actinomycetota bacterium]
MYRVGESLILSPSDLTAFLACEHLAGLERLVAFGELERPSREDPDGALLARRGDDHERAELARLEAVQGAVVRIEVSGSSPEALRADEQATLAAMRAGASVIYQATFFDGTWRGHADFLFRVATPSELGSWSYEVADTKLARRAGASALVQMACYSEQVARLQGVWPASMTVIAGDGMHHRFPVADVTSYVRFAKERLVEAVTRGDQAETYPNPVSHCRRCPWEEVCDNRRRVDDHLSLVARIRGDQVVKLERAGVVTMRELARWPSERTIPGMGALTIDRLRHQARLQVAARDDGVLRYELLDLTRDGRRGLAGLPLPSPGDLFVDFEGDPWVGEHGLEYLFGVLEGAGGAGDERPSVDGSEEEPRYLALWAHDAAGEKAAFEAFVDCIIERLEADPAMHVYHYAPYEVQAMKKLMSRYATREAEVDRLLRGEVMVDLYRVVTQGVRVSLESYGLKKLEPFYWPQRQGAIADGAASVGAYEEWREEHDDEILQELQDYNELDCRSTLALRDWLETLRCELETALGAPIPRFEPRAEEKPGDTMNAERRASETTREDEESAELVACLSAGVPDEAGERDGGQQVGWLLAQLVGWHRREAKPKWWAWFDRLLKSDEELVLDHESIGELTYVDEVLPDDGAPAARSRVHRYGFDPTQEHKVSPGDTPCDPRTGKGAGTVVALDQRRGFVDLKRATTNAAPHPSSVVPAGPVRDVVLRQGVARVARFAADHGIDAPGPYRAVCDVMARKPPRCRGSGVSGALVGEDESGSDAAVRLAPRLDSGYLAVQGPPGSGKTHTGARLIVALVQAGHQVGITAHSHKAIDNLLDAVCARAKDEGVTFRAVRKVNASDLDVETSGSRDPSVQVEEKNEVVESLVAQRQVDVVAGTAWLMARASMVGALHTLVIDEAGQFSLANLVAVGGAADNLVLLGDPQQLAQPTQAIHPVGADVSALEHILAGAATIPPDRGIFLEHSFRMHPEICDFVSHLAYDGRLQANAACARLHIESGPGMPNAGLGWAPVTHEGCRTRSSEEVAAVAAMVDRLVGCLFTSRQGDTRRLTPGDIMVIAPYNAQVALLSEGLPAGVRVGTVDRFQGQEAPVVIYSLAASSAEDVPRGLDFLFSPNRFNVAISRAQALAIVVGSPKLLATRCHRPEQLRLVNALCRFVEKAHAIEIGVEEVQAIQIGMVDRHAR